MNPQRRYWLMDLRRNNNMTIQSVSTKAKISKQYYSMLENGQRGKRLGFLIGVRIARSLGIGVDQFYENEETIVGEVFSVTKLPTVAVNSWCSLTIETVKTALTKVTA